MTIAFACPLCEQSFDENEARVGEAGLCAKCGKALKAPERKNRFVGAARSDQFKIRRGIWELIFAGGMILFVIAMLLLRVRRPGSSQKMYCQHNLKQIVLSVLIHENTHGRFPLASSQPFTGQPGTSQSPHPAGYSWQVALMPEWELDIEYNQWKVDSQEFRLGPFDPANDQAPPTHSVDIRICPASSTRSVDINRSEYKLLNTLPGYRAPARSSYLAFASSHFTNDTCPGQLYESDPKSPFDGNGAFPFPQAAADIQDGIKMSDIRDGTSHTLMFCESKETAYAAWCDGQAMWAVGAWPGSQKMPTVNGAPDGSLGWSDSDRQSRASIQPEWKANPADTYLSASRYHAQYDRRWGPSSEHRGVVYHAFADGSIRAINPKIDRNLYLRLISRDGSEQIDQAKWTKAVR